MRWIITSTSILIISVGGWILETRRRPIMLERWETRGERSYATAYVTKETSHFPATFSRPFRRQLPDSPIVDAICMVIGFLMLAATVALFWLMATAA